MPPPCSCPREGLAPHPILPHAEPQHAQQQRQDPANTRTQHDGGVDQLVVCEAVGLHPRLLQLLKHLERGVHPPALDAALQGLRGGGRWRAGRRAASGYARAAAHSTARAPGATPRLCRTPCPARCTPSRSRRLFFKQLVATQGVSWQHLHGAHLHESVVGVSVGRHPKVLVRIKRLKGAPAVTEGGSQQASQARQLWGRDLASKARGRARPR